MYDLTSKDKPPPSLATIVRHYVKKGGPVSWIVVIALVFLFYILYSRQDTRSYEDLNDIKKGVGDGPELAVEDPPNLNPLQAGRNDGENGAEDVTDREGKEEEDGEVQIGEDVKEEGDEKMRNKEDGGEKPLDVKIDMKDIQELDIDDQLTGVEILDKLKNSIIPKKQIEEKEKPKIPFNVHNHDLDEIDEDYIIAQQHNNDPNAMPVLPKFDPNRHIHGALPEGEVFYPSPKIFPVAQILTPDVENCPEVEPFILIIVVTQCNQSKHRNSIRRTWGRPSNFQKVALRSAMPWWVVFSMGTEDGMETIVREEQKNHGDIIQGDFLDHESEETRKTMQGLKWATEHLPETCRPSFIFKTECSVFINTPLLTKWIGEHFSHSFATYVGKLIRDDVPIRDLRSSLYVPEHDYIRDDFPPFIQGPSFLLSVDVATAMVALFRQVTPIAMEDAYIGLLAEKMGQAPKNEDKFQVTERPHNVCHYLEMLMMRTRKATVHHQIFNVVNHKDPKCTGPKDL